MRFALCWLYGISNRQLTALCLQSLHRRFAAWTEQDTTSLLLRSLTDLSRGKSELVTENVLLGKPLIVLSR